MATIYLQRHTQPALDLKLCYGTSDVTLRDEFVSEDLPQIIDRVRGLNPRVIYSSPLQRCDKLAQIIAKELNLGEVKIDSRTVELNFGDWELVPWSEIYERVEGRAWFDDYLNTPAPGGESFVEMVGRAESFLKDIIDTQDDIMVVTHGGFIRAMMVASGEVQLQDAFDVKVEYGDTVALEIKSLIRDKDKKMRDIMFVGTGSDVGKSVINTGFCRIFVQDGYSPAPFKAQNMSLNSYATPDQLEIGRAQAVQAEACGLACATDMNPILLKPTTHQSSQVILNGRPVGNKSAVDYFRRDNREELFVHAKAAFDRLQSEYNPVVLEGAGSISEVNLWDKDIVNMRMAEYANAATILVADIDRGGLFASVYGSVMLLPEAQRKLIKGVIVNKFRGDIELFNDGRRILEELTGVPVLGVLPYLDDVEIEQEDSVSLERRVRREDSGNSTIKVGVVALRSISNFTDFNVLERTKGVLLNYISSAEEVEESDIVIIPGSKSTISDIKYLRSTPMFQAILQHHAAGKPLYGICGGYQIMGLEVKDPNHIESATEQIAGLGILPVVTTIEDGKRSRQSTFKMAHNGTEGEGYEIHSGVTPTSNPLSILDDGTQDGYYLSDSCWGSYLHGIFDNHSVIEQVLSLVDQQVEELESYAQAKERNYNALADYIRKYVDVERIYKILKE